MPRLASIAKETSGTGLRRRFFITIFLVLCINIVATSFIYFSFFKNERIRLIDQQIEVIASSLLTSNIASTALEEMEGIVTNALGDDDMTTLVSLYHSNGLLIYRNENAKILFEDSFIPLQPEKYTIEKNGHRIRVLNLHISSNKEVLQIGLLLDKGQVRWSTLNRSVIIYIVIVFVLMFLASILLSYLLLSPLRTVAAYLHHISESVGLTSFALQLPHALEKLIQKNKKLDEFGELINSVGQLSKKIHSRFQMNQASAAQMAHELKTPLTIIRNSLESLGWRKEYANDKDLKNAISESIGEVDHLSHVINDFLEWSRAEHGNLAQEKVHAIHLKKFLNELCEKMNRIANNRIELLIKNDLTIFAKPEYALQVIRNLLENALKYSPQDQKVLLELDKSQLKIKDQGEGIPEEVLKRLGQPFNFSYKKISDGKSRGTGLGLAWVYTICEVYHWQLKFENTSPGTCATIDFEQKLR